jgi:hypothetical protein
MALILGYNLNAILRTMVSHWLGLLMIAGNTYCSIIEDLLAGPHFTVRIEQSLNRNGISSQKWWNRRLISLSNLFLMRVFLPLYSTLLTSPSLSDPKTVSRTVSESCEDDKSEGRSNIQVDNDFRPIIDEIQSECRKSKIYNCFCDLYSNRKCSKHRPNQNINMNIAIFSEGDGFDHQDWEEWS